MKLHRTVGYKGERVAVSDTSTAVRFVAEKQEGHATNDISGLRYRAEAAENMLGRLLEKLIANGVLRAEQVSEIFDYDVIAENE